MIVITVDLVSAVSDDRSRQLGRMIIANDGTGSETLRNYSVRTLRGRSKFALSQNIVQRAGKVIAHPAARLHIWHLVSKALQSVGYTGDHRRPTELRADEIAEFLRWKATKGPNYKPEREDELDTSAPEDERV